MTQKIEKIEAIASNYDVIVFDPQVTSGNDLACDLNSDGVTNNTDVDLAMNQALGSIACTNADLDQNGQCNVVDVQRLIHAVLGNGCRVGSLQ